MSNPETSSPAERNRPGSWFVELDLNDPSSGPKIDAYRAGLAERMAHWMQREAPYRAPERFPGPPVVEEHLLATLERDGRVNFWDEYSSPELARSHDPSKATLSYEDGCVNFVQNLGLEPQQIPEEASPQADTAQ